MEEDGEGVSNRHRVRGREREPFCCNVMLNSNMQCSHHSNGGSSEALHSAGNDYFVCVFACVSKCMFLSMHV